MNIFGMVTTTTSAPYTPYALESFFRCTPLAENDCFYLIDNDGTWSPSIPVHPAVTMIRNDSPRGFAANVNQVLRIAADHKADLFFLNNDVIFTPDWLGPLITPQPAVTVPFSNWKVQYQCGDFACPRMLDLDDFLGHEAALAEIARLHCSCSHGYKSMLSDGFFCVRIPQAVHAQLGPLDESFGPGGGEDTDYCLRCHLAGIPVLAVMQSYVLHFMGKSTWRGGESPEAQRFREQCHERVFIQKWGRDLFELTAHAKEQVLDAHAEARAAFKRGDWRSVVLLLQSGADS